MSYAKEYYNNTYHDYWYPPINSFVADKIPLKKSDEKINQILFITRFGSHKQDDIFFNLYCEEMRGYCFKFLIGSGEIPNMIYKKISVLSDKFGIKSEFLKGVTEEDLVTYKFVRSILIKIEIKQDKNTKLTPFYFTNPSSSFFLSNNSKVKFLHEVDRSSTDSKLSGFIRAFEL